MERNRLKEALIIAIKGERAVCGLETCDDCKCNTCRIAKILLKHGAVSRTLRDGEYTYKIEKDISSKFELEMWKLSNADTTEV